MAKNPTPARLEAFSDGVLAVIITIMVLEFKMPERSGFAGLAPLLPTLLVYALSFTFTGIYWINHHHIIDRLTHVDSLIMWMNLVFLFCLSLLPFFTDYVARMHRDSFSVAIYSAALLADAVAFTLLTESIVRHLRRARCTGHQAVQQELAEQVSEQRKGLFSLCIYLCAMLLAQWHPRAALGLDAIVTLIWIVPTFGVKPHHPPDPGAIGEWKR